MAELTAVKLPSLKRELGFGERSCGGGTGEDRLGTRQLWVSGPALYYGLGSLALMVSFPLA